MSSERGRVSLVGAGPGDPGLLTLRGAQLLRSADVLLYDALASDAIVALAPPSCERIYVGKRAGDHAMEQEEIERLAIAKAREGRHVVRLKGGDPFVFGRGGEEAEALRAAGIAFEIVPGVSSAPVGVSLEFIDPPRSALREAFLLPGCGCVRPACSPADSYRPG